MRNSIMPLLAAVAVFSSAAVHADLGDQLFKLLPEDGAAQDWFGRRIAIDNGVAAVGAYHDDDNGYHSGSAYLFDAEGAGKCPWDLDNSGSVGTNDLLTLFAQWGTDGPADFDESGAVGTGDLLILFANWVRVRELSVAHYLLPTL